MTRTKKARKQALSAASPEVPDTWPKYREKCSNDGRHFANAEPGGDSDQLGHPGQMLRMARCAVRRSVEYRDPVAPCGLEVVLEMAFPETNAICERVIGTIRCERLDWLIPSSESHLRSMLKGWVTHYDEARAHRALGPGVPDPPVGGAARQ